MSVLVEVVACTADDAVRAEDAGAGRIELVSAISEGGLTPSIGILTEVKRRCRTPVIAMLRPRGGGFNYSEAEFATMKRDAQELKDAGADGLVTGMLSETGEIDDTSLRPLIGSVRQIQWVFHRAFDSTQDPFAALECLIDLGFSRVLTSGQAPTAAEGAGCLRRLADCAAGRIEIMPGGGVRAANMTVVIESIGGCGSIHAGPFRTVWDPVTGAQHLALDEDAVRDLVEAVRQ